MSLKSKLNQMKKHIVRDEEPKKEEAAFMSKADSAKDSKEIPYLSDWKEFGAIPHFLDDEYIFIREKFYPLTHQHGLYPFSKLFEVKKKWEDNRVKHPLSLAGYSINDLFFFDTETTGLRGGTGTTVFLLGSAKFSEEGIILKQYFLPQPSAEAALYYYFLKDVENCVINANYNGKSFDWPQVKTRHTLLRNHLPELPVFEHLDLLHGARRLWKHKLDSVKLVHVEKEILQIERHNDVPGFLAPIIYFDFLESRNPRGVFEVITHNEHDVLSLITLYTHMSEVLLESFGSVVKEIYEAARWYDKVGEKKEALKRYEHVSKSKKQEQFDAKMVLAAELKRAGEWENAVNLWKDVHESGSELLKIKASIELAKVYEHRYKRVNDALMYAEDALRQLEKQKGFDGRKEPGRTEKEFAKRIKRLKSKMADRQNKDASK